MAEVKGLAAVLEDFSAEHAELMDWFTKAGGDPKRFGEWEATNLAAKELGSDPNKPILPSYFGFNAS